jgi:hypothetical protein
MPNPTLSRHGSGKRRKQAMLNVRCSNAERKRWARAALADGMPMSVWVRRLLNQHASDVPSAIKPTGQR